MMLLLLRLRQVRRSVVEVEPTTAAAARTAGLVAMCSPAFGALVINRFCC
ncbi:hypothetical protein DAI22_02g223800 [Oryza sativa Japonica Group]|nr:hypothetical protein DAI22_02g223800 [Oryza sativa Japonica Group]